MKYMLSKRVYAPFGLFCFIAVFFVSIFLGSTQEAVADAKMCRALKTELASLRSQSVTAAGGGSSEKRRFANLAKRQQRALRSAQRDAVSLQCITRSGKRSGKGGRSCSALLSKIKKMRRNLSRLEKQRNNASGSSSRGLTRGELRTKKRSLKRKISRLRCNQLERIAARDARERRRAERRNRNGGGLLARLFGRPSRYAAPEEVLEDENAGRKQLGSIYRTLCVRMSDGYYFPISFATVRSEFASDEARCQASDLGEELRLFVHRNPNEEPEDMVDLTGIAYAELPNAFLYRTKFVARIRPLGASNLTHHAGRKTAAGKRANDPRFRPYENLFGETGNVILAPSPKPDLFSDPDTAYAIAGNFSLKPVNEIKEEKQQQIIASENGSKPFVDEIIRVIGPKFLDDQQSVKLLLAPDQIQVQ